MGRGEVKLATQVVPKGYFGKVTVEAEAVDSDGEVTVEFDPSIHNRFTLMETILQSFEAMAQPLDSGRCWQLTLELLEKNIQLHLYSVWYWSDVENENGDDSWRVTPFLRKLLEKHWSGAEKGTP